MKKLLASVLGLVSITGNVTIAAPLQYAQQGEAWTDAVRQQFYTADQGSRLMPYSWLASLKEANGQLFMRNQMTRFGYLANKASPYALPVGFSITAPVEGERQVGLTCSACHTRDITSGGKVYRIDGGSALIDFEAFLRDLNAAIKHTISNPRALDSFKKRVKSQDPSTNISQLEDNLKLWSTSNDTIVSRSLPTAGMWGTGRIDALSMIMNRFNGLEIGRPEDNYLIPENIFPANAPAKLPFIWNAPKQDMTQWPGVLMNGNDQYAIGRNFGEAVGVFAVLRPKPMAVGQQGETYNDYLSENTVNWTGISELEQWVKMIGPPRWPWSVNTNLAAKGEKLYADNCDSCHGIKQGKQRGAVTDTWATIIENVQTDTAEWAVLNHQVKTGVMKGVMKSDGTLLGETSGGFDTVTTVTLWSMLQKYPEFASTPQDETVPTTPGGYEARVLQGVWATAPYLHNGSVASLEELLKPSQDRKKSFRIGTNYDPSALGLAKMQANGVNNVRHVTGCDKISSGNSNCGHEYGTSLSSEEKKALLEFMKTL